MDDIEFKNVEELYTRLKPALDSKLKELHLLGYKIVSSRDIWTYLVKNNWKNRTQLSLSDMVSDILYVDNYSIYDFTLNKLQKIKGKEESSIL